MVRAQPGDSPNHPNKDPVTYPCVSSDSGVFGLIMAENKRHNARKAFQKWPGGTLCRQYTPPRGCCQCMGSQGQRLTP